MISDFRELLSVGDRITVKNTGKDQYGRILGEIYSKTGINVNKKMVETGMAVLYFQSQPACSDYHQIERTAKATKTGVWSDPDFVMPFFWRKTTTRRPATIPIAIGK